LRVALLTHACVADIVLDLHADNEAQLHMYTTPELWPEASDLAAEIDARAVLLAEDSGGGPFDEACSRPWRLLAERFPEANLPPACLAATLELRSNNDLDFEDAWRDARALYRFLQRRKVVAGDPGRLPRLLCRATDLTAMQQVKAPQAGLVVYHARLGDRVQKGEIVAEIVPPVGESVLIEARTDGILFARHNERWAWEGRIIGKIAGEEALPERQEGDLLSP
jgi:predicted deacylase